MAKLYAVLTGDIIGFSDYDQMVRVHILDHLQTVLSHDLAPFSVVQKPDIFRGDSFQCLLQKPEMALRSAVFIRGGLRTLQFYPSVKYDSRISIGIGTIDHTEKDEIDIKDGQAYRLSGHLLDSMKGRERLLFATPWPQIDRELNAAAGLIDVLIEQWTPDRADAVLKSLNGKNQKEIANMHKISQPAVSKRLSGAGEWALKKYLEYFEKKVIELTS